MSANPLSYYLALLTSEYQNAPSLKAYLTFLLTPVDDLNACLGALNAAFDVDTAVGVQLDVIGQLVGANRTLPFQPPGGAILTWSIAAFGTGYTIGDVITAVQGGASGGTFKLVNFGGHTLLQQISSGIGYADGTGLATTGGTGTGLTVNITASGIISPVLGDGDYRTLLLAKIAQNEWDGTIDSLYPTWQLLFPGGTLVVNDNQDMTATIVLTGSFSQMATIMIQAGLIVPRPEGVLYNYIFGTLPLFGFDRNDGFVAGWDTGHWA